MVEPSLLTLSPVMSDSQATKQSKAITRSAKSFLIFLSNLVVVTISFFYHNPAFNPLSATFLPLTLRTGLDENKFRHYKDNQISATCNSVAIKLCYSTKKSGKHRLCFPPYLQCVRLYSWQNSSSQSHSQSQASSTITLRSKPLCNLLARAMI